MSLRRKRCLTLAILFGAAAQLGACDGGAMPDASRDASTASDSITVTDDAGRSIALDAPAQRIVSLLPAVTDLVIALGAADRLVARTQYDTDPILRQLPSVGGGLTPSLEWLTARRPDLVIAWRDEESRSVVARLSDLGVKVYSAKIETLADVDSTIRRMGLVLGRERAADSLRESMRRQFDDVRRAVAGRPRPSVLYAVELEPPMAVGPRTFLDELVTVAGGRNVLHDAPAQYAQVGLEEMVRRQPDVIVVSRADEPRGWALPRLRTLAGWRELRAVRDGQVVEIEASLFNRPGPRLPQAARELAALLHPGAAARSQTP